MNSTERMDSFDATAFGKRCFPFLDDDESINARYFFTLLTDRSYMHEFLSGKTELLAEYDSHFADILEAFPFRIYQDFVSKNYEGSSLSYKGSSAVFSVSYLPVHLSFDVSSDMSDFFERFYAAINNFDISREALSLIDRNTCRGVNGEDLEQIISGLKDFRQKAFIVCTSLAELSKLHESSLNRLPDREDVAKKISYKLQKLEKDYPLMNDMKSLVIDAVESVLDWSNGNSVRLNEIVQDVLFSYGVGEGNTEKEFSDAAEKIKADFPSPLADIYAREPDLKAARNMVEKLLEDNGFSAEQFVSSEVFHAFDYNFCKMNAYPSAVFDSGVREACSLDFGFTDNAEIVRLFEDSGIYKNLSHDVREPFFRNLLSQASQKLSEFVSDYLKDTCRITDDRIVQAKPDVSYNGDFHPLDYRNIDDVNLFRNFLSELISPVFPSDHVSLNDAYIILKYDANIEDLPDQFAIRNGTLFLRDSGDVSDGCAAPQKDYDTGLWKEYVSLRSPRDAAMKTVSEIFSRTVDLYQNDSRHSADNIIRFSCCLDSYVQDKLRREKKRTREFER